MKKALMVLASALALSCMNASGQERSRVFDKILQKLRRPGITATTDSEKVEIQKLIDSLTELDNVGFAGVFLPTGIRFTSVYSEQDSGTSKRSPSAQKLVSFGPKALPQWPGVITLTLKAQSCASSREPLTHQWLLNEAAKTIAVVNNLPFELKGLMLTSISKLRASRERYLAESPATGAHDSCNCDVPNAVRLYRQMKLVRAISMRSFAVSRKLRS